MAKCHNKQYNARPRRSRSRPHCSAATAKPKCHAVLFVKIIDLPYQKNSETLFLKLSRLSHCVWLDSGKPDSAHGRYDIISALPGEILSADSDRLDDHLEKRLEAHTNTCDLPFSGGWIGQFSYDYRNGDFGLTRPHGGLSAWFGWYEWAVVVDHKQARSVLLTLPTCHSDIVKQVQQALSVPAPPASHFTCSAFAPDEGKDRYLASVARIKEYLVAGDCYQVNYTQRFSANFSGSTADAYIRLRNTVPSPFCAYLDLGQSSLLSVSPERFIQLQQQQALTQPIKGTVRRGDDTDEDTQLKEQLLQSAKNRAENVMIVDLLRNDLGQLCLPGTVKVPQLFEVQSFANVHHLVSTISGTLPAHISHVRFLLSCFPGGSITGAPKKRAMQIIEELELHSRSAYCGSIGYFSCNGNTDFNVAIRTMEQKDGRIHAWAGGGIVTDSEPEAEYDECFAKISHLMQALASRTASER